MHFRSYGIFYFFWFYGFLFIWSSGFGLHTQLYLSTKIFFAEKTWWITPLIRPKFWAPGCLTRVLILLASESRATYYFNLGARSISLIDRERGWHPFDSPAPEFTAIEWLVFECYCILVWSHLHELEKYFSENRVLQTTISLFPPTFCSRSSGCWPCPSSQRPFLSPFHVTSWQPHCSSHAWPKIKIIDLMNKQDRFTTCFKTSGTGSLFWRVGSV